MRCARAIAILLMALLTTVSAQNTSTAQHQQGLSAFRKGDLNSAIRHLRQSVGLEPTNAEAWNDLGVILRKQQNNKEAIDCFRKAVEIKPDFLNARYNLSLAYEAENDFDHAADQASRVVQLSPGLAKGHLLYGRLLSKTNRLEAAEKELRQAVQLDPSLSKEFTCRWGRCFLSVDSLLLRYANYNRIQNRIPPRNRASFSWEWPYTRPARTTKQWWLFDARS